MKAPPWTSDQRQASLSHGRTRIIITREKREDFMMLMMMEKSNIWLFLYYFYYYYSGPINRIYTIRSGQLSSSNSQTDRQRETQFNPRVWRMFLVLSTNIILRRYPRMNDYSLNKWVDMYDDDLKGEEVPPHQPISPSDAFKNAKILMRNKTEFICLFT